MESTYPECLHDEIEATARELYERRVAEERSGSPLEDWLEAETHVKESHRGSPARLLPGGDLFRQALED